MSTHRFWLLACCLLVACSGDTNHRASTTVAAATPATTVVRGRVAGVPEGGLVFLLIRDPDARDVASLARTFLTSTEVAPDGRFELRAPGPLAVPSQLEVVVSAPGRSLTRCPVGSEAELILEAAAEAVVELTVTGPGGSPEEDAMAIVLDRAGIPLPLPAVDLAADAGGRLRATRLPAGGYELLVGSGDGQRHARVLVDVVAGETLDRSVVLRVDPDTELRFYRAIGGPAKGLADLMEGGAR